MPLLRNKVAKQYVQKKNVLYTTFTNALTNKTATDGNIKKRIQGLLGSKDLQNLYSKSRTGFGFIINSCFNKSIISNVHFEALTKNLFKIFCHKVILGKVWYFINFSFTKS